MTRHGFLALRIRDLDVVLLFLFVVVRKPLTRVPRQYILVVAASDEYITI